MASDESRMDARFYQAAIGVALGTALAVCVGCSGNVALVGRSTLQLDQEEIFAEIVRVDTGSREIYLRPDDGRDRVISYGADARVIYRGQAYPITKLVSGDKVSLQLQQDSRGKFFTDLVRVHESSLESNLEANWNIGAAQPETTLQKVHGRIPQRSKAAGRVRPPLSFSGWVDEIIQADHFRMTI